MKKYMFLILVSGLYGCAASGPKYSEVQFEKNPNMSEVIIFREKKFVDSGSCYQVQLDGKNVGVLANGGFLRTEVNPGDHKLTIPMINKNRIEYSFESQANETVFTQFHPALNASKVIPESEIIAQSEDFNHSQGAALNFNYAVAQVKGGYANNKLVNLADSSVSPSCMMTLRVEN